MPKVKVPRKSTVIDMTAMCDVAFLLLTFFMLTSNFTQSEAIVVAVPSSASDIKIPERDIATVLVDKEGKIFFGLDAQQDRRELLENVGKAYEIEFTDKELIEFGKINSFGVPIEKMKAFLALESDQRNAAENTLGIPIDSTNNQFKIWMRTARQLKGRDLRLAIKSDQNTPYVIIKDLMNTLKDIDENRYNLITSLKTVSE